MTAHILGTSLVVLLLSVVSQSYGAGCNGYRMKVFDMTNRCPGGNEVIEFKNFKLDFSNDCKVVASGCITLKRSFTYAKSNWRLRHGMMRKDGGSEDACKSAARQHTRTVLDNLGFGNHCPGTPQTRCYNRTPLIDISQYASQIQMASGQTNMIVDTDHGDAGKNCIKLRVNIGL